MGSEWRSGDRGAFEWCETQDSLRAVVGEDGVTAKGLGRTIDVEGWTERGSDGDEHSFREGSFRRAVEQGFGIPTPWVPMGRTRRRREFGQLGRG